MKFMRLLFYIIPLLPFIFYMIYYSYKKRTLKKDEILVGVKNAPWVKLTFIGLITLIALILYLTFTSLEPQGESYTPAQYKDGKLIPNKID